MKASIPASVAFVGTTLFLSYASVTNAQTCPDMSLVPLNSISMDELLSSAVDTIVFDMECPASGSGSFSVPANLHWHVTEQLSDVTTTNATTTTKTFEIRTTPANFLDPYLAGNELRFRLTAAMESSNRSSSSSSSQASEAGVEIIIAAGTVTHFILSGVGSSVALSLMGGSEDITILDRGTSNTCWVNSTTNGAILFEGSGVDGNVIIDAAAGGGVKNVVLSGVTMNARVKGTVTSAALTGTTNSLLVQGSVVSGVTSSGVSNTLFLNGPQICSDINIVESGVDNQCEPTEDEVIVGDLACTTSSSDAGFDCIFSAARRKASFSATTTNLAASLILSFLLTAARL